MGNGTTRKAVERQVQVDLATHGNKILYVYKTYSDQALFKTILSLDGFRYHRPLKRLVSAASDECLIRLEYAVGPTILINTFALRKKLLEDYRQHKGQPQQLPDYRYPEGLPFLWVSPIRKEGQNYFMLKTEKILALKRPWRIYLM